MNSSVLKKHLEDRTLSESLIFTNEVITEAQFSQFVVPAFVKGIKCQNLYLEKLSFTDHSIKSITTILTSQTCSLVVLSLENNLLTDVGISELVKILPRVPSLKS
jgi:hypothetical protein